MNIQKTILLSACFAIAPISALAQDAEIPDDVFAVVNGEEISNEFVARVLDNNELQPEQVNQLLEQIIANFAIAQEATKLGYPDKPEVQTELEISNRLVLIRAYLRDFVEDNPITAEVVEAEYEKLKSSQEGRKEYRSRHILVETEEEANQVVSDADGNLDEFIKLAKEKSVDTGSGQNGGELGWAVPENFVPEFSVALAELEPGSFSGPVETQFGWHVIYLDDVRDVPVPELSNEFREAISEQLRQTTVKDEIDRLVGSADVKVNEKLLSASELVNEQDLENLEKEN